MLLRPLELTPRRRHRRRRVSVGLSPTLLLGVPAQSLPAGPSAQLVKTWWPGKEVEGYKKKYFAINQLRKELELWKSLPYFYTKQVLYLYGTTPCTEAEVWPGVGDGIFSGA